MKIKKQGFHPAISIVYFLPQPHDCPQVALLHPAKPQVFPTEHPLLPHVAVLVAFSVGCSVKTALVKAIPARTINPKTTAIIVHVFILLSPPL
jgi:hypothetical protein